MCIQINSHGSKHLHRSISPSSSSMGNSHILPSCLNPHPNSSKATVILPGGATRLLKAPCPAAELLVEFPDRLLCDADTFFFNHPLPSVSLNDTLLPRHTYLLIPSDRLPPSPVLSAASIASLSRSSLDRKPISFGVNPFEYVKDARGETAIKISRDFLIRALTGVGEDGGGGGSGELRLCSTPELRRHYEQLVGTARVQPWSPQLQTIEERKRRNMVPTSIKSFSPSRIVGALKVS